VPFGATRGDTAIGLTIIMSGTTPVCPAKSVAVRVTLYVPAVVGIPPRYEETPLLPDRMTIPAGSVKPFATDHVKGGTPPVN
jgi:hypothetical protein